MALSGKRIIEYPTFVVGPQEFLTKLEYFVKELSQCEVSNADQFIDSPMTTKRPLKEIQPIDSCEIDLSENQIKHPRLPVDRFNEDECGLPQKMLEYENFIIPQIEEAPSDGDEDEDECGEEFIKQLELLQSQDISSLQQLIVSMEDQTSSS